MFAFRRGLQCHEDWESVNKDEAGDRIRCMKFNFQLILMIDCRGDLRYRIAADQCLWRVKQANHWQMLWKAQPVDLLSQDKVVMYSRLYRNNSFLHLRRRRNRYCLYLTPYKSGISEWPFRKYWKCQNDTGEVDLCWNGMILAYTLVCDRWIDCKSDWLLAVVCFTISK